ncbi:hypothetical protein CPB85DRAFT_1436676 [Mucidula mucida]|nr:hypothetical protein CPB85DRAFT_1436676 [Mucidula mucida]
MNRAQQYFDQLFNLPETRRYAVQLAAEMLSRHTFGPKKERVPVQGLPAEAYYSCELAVKESRGVTAPNNAGSAESFEVMVHLRGRVSVPDQTQPGSQVFAQCGSVDSSLGILYLTTRRRAAVHLAQYNTTREIADALCPILTWDAGPDSAITYDCIVHETADRFNRQHYTLVKRVGRHQSQVGPDVYKRQDWPLKTVLQSLTCLHSLSLTLRKHLSLLLMSSLSRHLGEKTGQSDQRTAQTPVVGVALPYPPELTSTTTPATPPTWLPSRVHGARNWIWMDVSNG